MTVEARLRCPPWASRDFSRHVAVGVRLFPNGLTHSALLNRSGKNVLALEVREHGDLRNDVASSSLSFVHLDVESERERMIAARCRLIHKRHGAQGLPYAFRFKATRFADDGSAILGEAELGVTCATFVLAVLASEGIELVEVASWPDADSTDRSWQAFMINVVRRKDASQADLLFAEEIGAPRFRPEEVAGAAAVFAGAPLSFDQVAMHAAAVMGKLVPTSSP